ncbi:MAG: hypothetical protein GXO57_05010 [Thermodesulfobacteria bacterium]|nr:hypothetical protein [Thermodesulfobacteriota bacterium]
MREKLRTYKLLTWYKKLREEQIQAELNKQKKVAQEISQKIKEVKTQREKKYEEMENKKVFTGEELLSKFTEIFQLQELEKRFNHELEEKKKEINFLFQRLMQEFKERQLMERLTEKTEEAWRFEELKKFYKEMDDLVVLRYKRS